LGAPGKSGPPPQRGYGALAIRASRTYLAPGRMSERSDCRARQSRSECAPSMGAIFGVQVPGQADHSEASETQLREGDRAWEGSVERKP
jgi:hypothetical protein